MRKSLLGLLLLGVTISGANAQNICLRANNDFTSANGTNGVTNPKYIAKGDINNDGILDVITSNGNTSVVSSVSIFYGQGNGLFVYQDTVTITPNACNTQGIVIEDFDGDGFADFAVVKRTNSPNLNFRVMRGDGTGNFTIYADLQGPNLLTDIVSGDFDNDGLKDAVSLAATSNGTLSFFKNNGAGFNAPVNSVPSFTGLGYYAKSGQFDHLTDGNLDVVITRDGPGRLIFMKGTGTGTFTTGFNMLIGTAPRDLDLGDLNGDGNTDVAVAMSGSDSVHVVFTDGAGAVLSVDRYHSGGDGPQSLVVFDYDNDGDKDIVVANLLDFVVGLLINDGAGNFTLSRYEGFKDPQEMVFGNFDSDLKQDIVFTSGTKFLMYMGNDSPNGFTSYNNLFYPTLTTLPNSSASADFNGDGFADVVSANSTTTTFSLFNGDGTGSFTFGANTSTGSTAQSIQAGDFDGDGDNDVLLIETTGQSLSLYPGDGAGGFGVPVSVALPAIPTHLIARDLDGDTDLDAVITSSASGSVYVYQNAAGVFTLASTLTTGLNTPVNATVANFNGDANPDLAIVNNGGSGTVKIFTGTGACLFASGNTVNFSSSPDVAAAGDFNGDGNTDIAVCYGSTNIISYATGDGTGAFSGATNQTISSAGFISGIVATDLNQDGIADIATSNSATHDVSVLKGSASGPAFQQAFFSGYKSVHIAEGYINNDQMPDLIVCNSDATGGGSSVAVLLNRSAKITNSGTGSFCTGSSVNLTSTEAFSYQWSTIATTQSISVNTSNSYTVTTGNFNLSCSSVSEPEVITVNPLPLVTSISGNTTICGSSSTTLTAVSSASSPSFQWFDAASGGSVLSSTADYTTPVLSSNTLYWVEVTDGVTGCVSSPRYQVDVVIGDITGPVIDACPSDITTNVAAGTCGAVVSWATPTATDNCGSATVNQTVGLPSGSTFPVGVHNIQYTATDASSNTSTCSFTITVIDNIDPTFTSCPANISQNASAGLCSAVVSWAAPLASDNCSATVTQTSGSISGSTFPVGIHSILYTATDPSGNTATCTFTVTVVDAEAPSVASCPANISITNTAGSCGATATWVAPTALDNCGGATIAQTSGAASGTFFPVGTSNVAYTATDAAGLTSVCSFTVTVNDNQAPTISGCPANMNFTNTSGVCGRIVSWTAPSATDNCSATITQTAGPASGSTFPIGVTTVTYSAVDPAGNTSTCSFTVTITDAQNPTISGLPSNMSVPAASGGCTATATWTIPSATDNCAGATITQTAGPAPGSTFPAGSTTITYTATDASGNTATGSFTVTVVDNIAPTFTSCPSNITACQGSPVTFPTPTATDNCTASPVITQTAGLPSGSNFPVGTTTVIFKATDDNGNFTNCTFTVTINVSPTVSFTLADDQVCEGDPLVNLSSGSPAGGIFSGPGITGSSFDPGTAGAGSHTITYTFTNGSGCSGTATDIMTVHAAPVVSFTVNDDLACIYHTGYAISGGAPAGGSYSGLGVSGGVFTPGNAGLGNHVITYSVTDANSCTGSATDIIQVSACTGIEELASGTLMKVFPNPSNGIFTIEFAQALTDAYNLEIYNTVGQIVHVQSVSGEVSVIDLSNLERGIYFLQLEFNGVRYLEKIIIER